MASIGQTQHMGSPDRLPPRRPDAPQSGQVFSSRSSDETPAGSESHPSMHSIRGGIQEAPLSPVRINFQNDEHAQPSTVPIENVNGSMRENRINKHARTNSAQYREVGSEATAREAPRRTAYPEQGQRHTSHAGIMSNMEGSPQPYNDEPSGSGNGRRSDDSNGSSGVMQKVPPLQYHHLPHRSIDSQNGRSPGEEYPPGRHLTPLSTTYGQRRSLIQRPPSTGSAYSELYRGPSPGYSPQHENGPMRRTPDGNRPGSYIDGQYPQAAPAFDNSGLRSVVGTNASLLSTSQTLAMYRDNLKKTQDPQTHHEFALLLVEVANALAMNEPETPDRKPSPKLGRDLESPYVETVASTSADLKREAKRILQDLSDRSYPYAQYYLADGYWTGYFNKGKEDFERAFGLFVAASKHGHAESSYRAALCYEFGWGTTRNILKAMQYFQTAAAKNHPGAMTRLGRAGLTGDLGSKEEKQAIKWLKRATESADIQHNDAPFYLGQLYEEGYGDDIFKDEIYAAELFTKAADLGHAEAAFRLGEAYEHGRLSYPRDPGLSIHFYTMASAKGHPMAMFNLCAWYMVGADPVLEKDEDEAYEWALRAAKTGTYESKFPKLAKSSKRRGFLRESNRKDLVWSVEALFVPKGRKEQSSLRPGATGAEVITRSRGEVIDEASAELIPFRREPNRELELPSWCGVESKPFFQPVVQQKPSLWRAFEKQDFEGYHGTGKRRPRIIDPMWVDSIRRPKRILNGAELRLQRRDIIVKNSAAPAFPGSALKLRPILGNSEAMPPSSGSSGDSSSDASKASGSGPSGKSNILKRVPKVPKFVLDVAADPEQGWDGYRMKMHASDPALYNYRRKSVARQFVNPRRLSVGRAPSFKERRAERRASMSSVASSTLSNSALSDVDAPEADAENEESVESAVPMNSPEVRLWHDKNGHPHLVKVGGKLPEYGARVSDLGSGSLEYSWQQSAVVKKRVPAAGDNNYDGVWRGERDVIDAVAKLARQYSPLAARGIVFEPLKDLVPHFKDSRPERPLSSDGDDDDDEDDDDDALPFPMNAKAEAMLKLFGVPFISTYSCGHGLLPSKTDFAVLEPVVLDPRSLDPMPTYRTNMSTAGLAKAEYAVGYFTEAGIGCRRDPLEANKWYVTAAEKGDKNAILRLQRIKMAAEGKSPAEMEMAMHVEALKQTAKEEKKMAKKQSRLTLRGQSFVGTPAQKESAVKELKRQGLPSRSSSLPAGAMELQLPLSPSSGNVNGGNAPNATNGSVGGGGSEKLAKTPGAAGAKEKDCVVM